MTDENETWDITIENVSPRAFMHLVMGVDHAHTEVHKAAAFGLAEEADVDAIHGLMEKVQDVPEGLMEATEALADELEEEASDEALAIADDENVESVEEAIKAAIDAGDVHAVDAAELGDGNGDSEDGNDSDGHGRMFQ